MLTFVPVSNTPGEIDRDRSIIASTSMDLHWKASPGKVDRYAIMVNGPSSGPDKFSSVGPSVVIRNLETDTKYEIAIYAISGSWMSEPRIEIIKTKDIKSKYSHNIEGFSRYRFLLWNAK